MRLALCELVVAADSKDMGMLLEAFKDMGVVMSKDKETNTEGSLDMDLGE